MFAVDFFAIEEAISTGISVAGAYLESYRRPQPHEVKPSKPFCFPEFDKGDSQDKGFSSGTPSSTASYHRQQPQGEESEENLLNESKCITTMNRNFYIGGATITDIYQSLRDSGVPGLNRLPSKQTFVYLMRTLSSILNQCKQQERDTFRDKPGKQIIVGRVSKSLQSLFEVKAISTDRLATDISRPEPKKAFMPSTAHTETIRNVVTALTNAFVITDFTVSEFLRSEFAYSAFWGQRRDIHTQFFTSMLNLIQSIFFDPATMYKERLGTCLFYMYLVKTAESGMRSLGITNMISADLIESVMPTQKDIAQDSPFSRAMHATADVISVLSGFEPFAYKLKELILESVNQNIYRCKKENAEWVEMQAFYIALTLRLQGAAKIATAGASNSAGTATSGRRRAETAIVGTSIEFIWDAFVDKLCDLKAGGLSMGMALRLIRNQMSMLQPGTASASYPLSLLKVAPVTPELAYYAFSCFGFNVPDAPEHFRRLASGLIVHLRDPRQSALAAAGWISVLSVMATKNTVFLDLLYDAVVGATLESETKAPVMALLEESTRATPDFCSSSHKKDTLVRGAWSVFDLLFTEAVSNKILMLNPRRLLRIPALVLRNPSMKNTIEKAFCTSFERYLKDRAEEFTPKTMVTLFNTILGVGTAGNCPKPSATLGTALVSVADSRDDSAEASLSGNRGSSEFATKDEVIEPFGIWLSRWATNGTRGFEDIEEVLLSLFKCTEYSNRFGDMTSSVLRRAFLPLTGRPCCSIHAVMDFFNAVGDSERKFTETETKPTEEEKETTEKKDEKKEETEKKDEKKEEKKEDEKIKFPNMYLAAASDLAYAVVIKELKTIEPNKTDVERFVAVIANALPKDIDYISPIYTELFRYASELILNSLRKKAFGFVHLPNIAPIKALSDNIKSGELSAAAWPESYEAYTKNVTLIQEEFSKQLVRIFRNSDVTYREVCMLADAGVRVDEFCTAWGLQKTIDSTGNNGKTASSLVAAFHDEFKGLLGDRELRGCAWLEKPDERSGCCLDMDGKLKALDDTISYLRQIGVDIPNDARITEDIIGRRKELAKTKVTCRTDRNDKTLVFTRDEYRAKRALFGSFNIDKLTYFVVMQSRMFRYQFRESMQALRAAGGNITIDRTTLEHVFVHCVELFQKLFSFETVTFHDFAEISRVVLDNETNFDQEVRLVLEAPVLRGIISAEGLSRDTVMPVIRSMLDYLSVRESCRGAIVIASYYKLCAKAELSALADLLSEATDTTLIRNAADITARIRDTFVGTDVPSDQLELFQVLQECIEVLKFFLRLGPKFDDRNKLVRSQHTSSLDKRTINVTTIVHRLLRPITDFIAVHNKNNGDADSATDTVSLKEFVHQSFFGSATAAADHKFTHSDFANIREINERLVELKTWYFNSSGGKLSLQNVIPFIRDVKIYGQYRSTLSYEKRPSGLFLYVHNGTRKEPYDSHYLDEMIRGMEIFLDSNRTKDEGDKEAGTEGEKTNEVEEIAEFARCYELAKEAHESLLKLEEFGHPEYQACIVDHNAPSTEQLAEFSAKHFEEFNASLKAILEDWIEFITKIKHDSAPSSAAAAGAGTSAGRARFVRRTGAGAAGAGAAASADVTGDKRVMFLEHNQLLKFGYLLDDLIKDPPKTEDKLRSRVTSEIVPYLWMCYPDAAAVIIKNGFQAANTIKNIIKAGASSKTAEAAAAPTKRDGKAVITNVVKLIHEVRTIPKRGDYNVWPEGEKEDETRERIKVIQLRQPNNGMKDVYNKVSSLLEGRVHPAYVFSCTAKSTRERLTNFLERVSAFPQMRFVVSEVNRLPLPLKELLMDWVSARFDAGKMCGMIYLLFTEPPGLELFNFVSTIPASDIPDFLSNEEEKKACSWFTDRKKVIRNVTLLSSGSLTGKSTAIKGQLFGMSNAVAAGASSTGSGSGSATRRSTTSKVSAAAAASASSGGGRSGNTVTLCVSVVEDFQPEVFSAALGRAIDENTGNINSVRVYFNVSPYAPLDVFGTFLYEFMLWGMVFDRYSGVMLSPSTKYTWDLYVELGTAPSGDDECSFTDTQKVEGMLPQLDLFPVVRSLPTPFAFSDELIWCVAAREASAPTYQRNFSVYLRRISGIRDVLSRHKSTSKPEVVHFLEEVSTIAPSLASRVRYIKLLSDKYVSMVKYLTALDKANTVPRTDDHKRIIAMCLKEINKDMRQFGTLPYSERLAVCAAFWSAASAAAPNKAGLVTSFASFVEHYHNAYKALDKDKSIEDSSIRAFVSEIASDIHSVKGQSRYIKALAPLCTAFVARLEERKQEDETLVKPGEGEREALGRLLKELFQSVDIRPFKAIPIITRYLNFRANERPVVMDFGYDSVSTPETPEKLERMCLRDVLEHPENLIELMNNVFQTEETQELLMQCGYVLTPDYALKFMLLNQCRGAGQNVILSGDTGTGKSELINMFALLVNLRTGVIPRSFDESRAFLAKRYPEQKDSIGNTQPKVLEFIERMCSTIDGFNAMRKNIADFTFEHVTKYKLVKRTSLVEKVMAAMGDKDGKADKKKEGETDDIEKTDSEEEGVDSGIETTLRDTLDVLQLVKDIWDEQMEELFHKAQMHQHISAEDFRRIIGGVRDSANKVRELYPELAEPVTVMGFIDECTSTEVMGMVKEVLIDKSLDGVPLPSNIMWIGAFNRNSLKDNAKHTVKNFYNGAEDDFVPDFAVRPPPESLEILEIKCDRLSAEQQKHFVRSLLELRNNLSKNACLTTPEQRAEMYEAISFSHEFLEDNPTRRIHPSVRDLVRCVDLYSYFRKHEAFYTSPSATPSGDETPEVRRHRYSLLLAIGFCYYFRIPIELRPKFAAEFKAHNFPIPAAVKAAEDAAASKMADAEETTAAGMMMKKRKRNDIFSRVFRATAMELYKNTAFLENVAPTDSFLQNLLFTVVSIDAKIPLMIVGPPGCSKSLSFTIAVKNMHGHQSKEDFYKALAYAEPQRYQCSKDSADTEIEAVYKNARELQQGFDSYTTDEDSERQRCVVLLDEVGLPDERKAPLKVLHYMLDHPQVSSVLLSNCILDAAKTNRVILLNQSQPDEDDLISLGNTCIYGNGAAATAAATAAAPAATAAEDSVSLDTKVARALARAYMTIIEEQDKPGNALAPVKSYFHLRDFVYFLRYLGREVKAGRNPLDPDVLVRALMRNFGGVQRDMFHSVVGIFWDALGHEVAAFDKHGVLERLRGARVIDALQESLSDKIDDPANPNAAPFRYALVLDPSDSEAAIPLLFEHGICSKDTTEVQHVANFSNDLDDVARTKAISRMKSAMEAGRTVILVNVMSISSAFYDVFNKHFDVVSGDDVKQPNSPSDTPQSAKYNYYSNIAVGSFSEPCLVDSEFRVIVYLPYSQLPYTPAPFLNRFEKYYMSLEAVLFKVIENMNSSQKQAVLTLKAGCEEMLSHFQGERFFFGLVPNETLVSLLLPIAEEMARTQSDAPRIPPVFHPNGDNVGIIDANLTSDQAFTRALNYHLFQLARPECVFADKSVPKAYLEEYLLRQEHFSVARLIGKIWNKQVANVEEADKSGTFTKWGVFTRSCGEVSRMHLEKESALRAALLKETDLLANNDSEVDKVATFVALGSVKSSADYRDAFTQFMNDATKRVFVCIIDMQTCTSEQINLARTLIDNCDQDEMGSIALTSSSSSNVTISASGPRRVAVFLYHFPPEMQLIQSVLSAQAVFVHGWNFSYVDALGFSVSASDSESIKSVDERSSGSKSFDVRPWLGYAFGLRNLVDMAAVEEDFKERIIERAARVRFSRSVCRNKALLPKTIGVYNGGWNKTFPKVLKQLVKEHPTAFTEYVKKVIKIWGSKLLYGIVRMDCIAIQKGERAEGLLEHVGDALSRFLDPAAVGLARLLCDNLGLESIIHIAESPARAEEEHLLETVMRGAPVCGIEQLCKSIAAGSGGESTSFSIDSSYPNPTYLPLFNTIFTRVESLAENVRGSKSTVSNDSMRGFLAKLEEAVRKDPVYNAVKCVANSPYLLKWYKRDFVIRGMRLPDFFVPRVEIDADEYAATWIDTCVRCIERLSEGQPDNVLMLHVIPRYHMRDFAFLAGSISPLKAMRPPCRSFDLFDGALELKCPQDVYEGAIISAVHAFWDRVQEACAMEEGYVELLRNLSTTFRDFRTRIPYRSRITTSFRRLSQEDAKKLDYLFIMHMFFLHAGLPFADAAAAVRSAVLASQANEYTGSLEGGIAFSEAIIKVLNEEVRKAAKLNRFIESVVMYYIEFDPKDASDAVPFPQGLQDDIKYLLSSSLSGKSLSAYLTPMWVLQVVGRWLRTKPLAWNTVITEYLATNGPDIEGTPDMLHMDVEKLGPWAFVNYHILHQQQSMQLAGAAKNRLQFIIKKLRRGDRLTDIAVQNAIFLRELALELTEEKTMKSALKLVTKSGADAFVKGIFADSRFKNSKFFFFCAFEVDEKIAEICSWKDLIEGIGLPEYYIEIDIKCMSLYLPAFIVSARHPLHQIYMDVRAAIETATTVAEFLGSIKAIAEEPTRPEPIKACIVNTLKMMIILSTYYDFYIKDIKCAVVGDASKNEEFRKYMDILPREAAAFSVFANGQVHLADPEVDQVLDPLTALFSHEGRMETAEAKFDPTISHLMVNLLAYSFGCSRDKSYLYERIFDLPALSHTYGPGSSFNRENRDCGFIMTRFDSEGRGYLGDDSPQIMNNIMGYRFALNSTFWCLVTMSQVVNDSWRDALDVYSLISYIEDVDISYKGKSRTQRQKVRTYLFERACGFFNQFKYDPLSKDLHIDQIHFINEVLYEHWIISNNIDPARPMPSAVKSHFSTKEEAVRYEDVLLDLFNRVKSDYNERKKMLREQVLLLYKQLSEVMDVRSQNVKHLRTPLFEMREFSSMISDKDTAPKSSTEATLDENEDFARDHIQNFYSYEKDFPKMKYLPTISQFYTELINTLDYKVTPEAARELIMPDLVKRFSDGGSGEGLSAMWDKFIGAWNATKEMLRPECDLAAEYEAQAAELETALLSETVKLSDDPESTGGQIVMLMKDGFARIQDPLLENVQTKQDNEFWNRDELCFNPKFGSVVFDTLSPDSDNNQLVLGENYEGEFELFVFSQMQVDDTIQRDSIRYNWVEIAKFITQRYLSGRQYLEGTGNISKEFCRVCHVLIDEDLRAVTRPSELIFEAFNPMRGVKSLKRFTANLQKKNIPEIGLRVENRHKLDHTLKGLNESSFMELAEIMSVIARDFIANYKQPYYIPEFKRLTLIDAYSRLSEKDVPKQLTAFLTSFTCDHLVMLSQEVIERTMSKGYMFQDLGCHYTAQLPEEALSFLNKVEREFREDDNQKDVVSGLNITFEILNLNKKLLVPDTTLRTVFGKLFASLNSSQKRVAQRIIVEKTGEGIVNQDGTVAIFTAYYASFMRWLSKLLGDLKTQLDAESFERLQLNDEEETVLAHSMSMSMSIANLGDEVCYVENAYCYGYGDDDTGLGGDDDDDDDDIVIMNDDGNGDKEDDILIY